MLKGFVLSLISSTAMAGDLISTFQALQNDDGSQTWMFTVSDAKADSGLLRKRIAMALANAHWCPKGWEETSRSALDKALVIEGRCK